LLPDEVVKEHYPNLKIDYFIKLERKIVRKRSKTR